MVHYAFCLLPKPNRDVLEVLLVFLRLAAEYAGHGEEVGSRMDVENLATVFAPCVLYPKDPSRGAEDAYLAIGAVRMLIQHEEEMVLVGCFCFLSYQWVVWLTDGRGC